MRYLESILNVLVVGLILGAGLPALFATGMLAYSHGAGGEDESRMQWGTAEGRQREEVRRP